jgi:hypothetical protein
MCQLHIKVSGCFQNLRSNPTLNLKSSQSGSMLNGHDGFGMGPGPRPNQLSYGKE